MPFQHSLVFCSLTKSTKYGKVPGLWKFNNSLTSNNAFVEEMKNFIRNTKLFLEQNDSFSNQSKWEFLKYEIRKKVSPFQNFWLKNLEIAMLN